MPGPTDFDDINEAKASMVHIYDQPDPRAYFRELEKLDYVIPSGAQPIFRHLIDNLKQEREDGVCVLDLGCSYGVNAALLKHDLSMEDLYGHWGTKDVAGLPRTQILSGDKAFFAGLDGDGVSVIGFDQAANAVGYAEEVGLLDHGVACNLEAEPLPEELWEPLKSVDMVTSTGCVGYVTERSFERLMPAVTAGHSPWFANFVLRMFPFDPIAETLAEWGYVTEKLEGETFIQRRFSSDEERDSMLGFLAEHGIDPAGKEADGHLHAEFFLSRPAAAAKAMPLETLLPG